MIYVLKFNVENTKIVLYLATNTYSFIRVFCGIYQWSRQWILRKNNFTDFNRYKSVDAQ